VSGTRELGATATVWLAWTVHAYTASGAFLAFLATLAIFAGGFRTAFLWLFTAVVIDATDGWLARRVHVGDRLPEFSGPKLDDLIDYLTFVFVPALLLWRANLLPRRGGVAIVAVILMSSAYGFARDDAKTVDHFFTGFPSYWNVVALYLFVAGLPPVANGVILVALAALIFVRVGYIYPTRTPMLRRLTLALAALWAATILAMILALPHPPPALVEGSLFFPVYYTALSLVVHARRSRYRERRGLASRPQ
jgi:phosphatidylcholine synthase